MLYPSQVEAKDLLKQSLSTNAVSIVDGLSGSGKSLIVEQALLEGFQGLAVEARKIERQLAQIQEAIGKNLRVVILTQPGADVSLIPTEFKTSASAVKVRSLTPDEIGLWMDSTEPALTPQERECILQYSLGVPLLIERLCKLRPITQVAAFTQCSVYLQSLIESCFLGGKDRNQTLQQVLGNYTDFQIPDDILANLADWEYARKRGTPLTVLTSRLSQNRELPTPTTLEIFALYDEWLQRNPDEPTFDIFVREMENVEQVLEDIGYCLHPNRNALLRRFIMADARKGATFFAGIRGRFCQQMNNLSDGGEEYLNTVLLMLARTSGVVATVKLENKFGRDVVQLQLQDALKALYLHKHDHSPSDVMPVAYAIECSMQKMGLAYTVKYDDKLFSYDPEAKCYILLEAMKVDYFRELYGDLDE